MQFEGQTWRQICREIVGTLPQNVYISFDIDGLEPNLCPHTGTPVAGGLMFWEAVYLLKMVVSSGRKIIGFDLSEVGGVGNEWDGNVGARILYKLANLMGQSNHLKF
jgi:agmatinase